MATAVITGSAGFLGRHLCRLLADDYQIIGAQRAGAAPVPDSRHLTVETGDDLALAIESCRPAVVIHAAFINRKPAGWSEREYLDRLTGDSLAVMDACARNSVNLLLVSSSAVYGRGEDRELIDESCPRQPLSLYGVAKAYQEMLGQHYVAARGLKLCMARLFNLCGPGQQRGMLLPDWVSQAAAIARGAEPVLRVRNRATSRDFVDVRDAARALLLLANGFRAGEVVNVASGHAVSLLDISDALARLCPVPYEVQEIDATPADSDTRRQCGSFQRIQSGWGWSPQIDWRTSLRDLWESYA